MTRADLLLLRAPIGALVGALLIAALVGGYARQRALEARAAESAATQALAAARQRYLRSDTERAELERYLPHYRALEARGFVGPEPRVAWIDALRAASDAARLYGVDYELGPQQSTTLPGAPNTRLERSPLRISALLLHEVDLLRFLDAVEARKPGTYTVNGCVLTRLSPAGSGPVAQANVRADCEFALLSHGVARDGERAP